MEYYNDYIAATEPMFVKPREIKLLRRAGSPLEFFKSWS